MTDISLFAGKMAKRATTIRANASLLQRKVTEAIFTEVVRSTPVDTGLAVSNWFVGLGRKPLAYRFTPHFPGKNASTRAQNEAATIVEGRAVIRKFFRKKYASMTIANYLPYINRLNEGHSPQAPAGYIQAAFARGSAAIKGFKILEQSPVSDLNTGE